MTHSEESSAVKIVTKNTIRQQVLSDFETQGLIPSWHSQRPSIPRFPTVLDSVNKLAELSEYQNASTIVTKTGTTLKDVRLRALKDQKKLLVPIPLRTETGTLYLVEPPENADEKELLKHITRMGLQEKSTVVLADSNHRVDLVILGSFAVDKQGHRIGCGKDYCDLELAVMARKGMITEDTVIATIVHDIQVMESLPEALFEEHDVGVGLIITPTQTIRVSPPPPPPPGILWKLLTKSVLNLVPVLGELHDTDSKVDPIACELKAESEERETRSRRRIFRRSKPRVDREGENEGEHPRPTKRRSALRRRKTDTQGEQNTNGSGLEMGPGQECDGQSAGAIRPDHDRRPPSGRPRRPFRQRRRRGDVDEKQDGEKRQRSKYDRRREYQIDFSLCVRNLASDVRVRDLKNALAECHVKPAEIKWRGEDGSAVLHFARDGQEVNDIPTSMDGMISCLRNLKVSSSQDVGLVVEPYNRVTRIEVTDQVTSV